MSYDILVKEHQDYFDLEVIDGEPSNTKPLVIVYKINEEPFFPPKKCEMKGDKWYCRIPKEIRKFGEYHFHAYKKEEGENTDSLTNNHLGVNPPTNCNFYYIKVDKYQDVFVAEVNVGEPTNTKPLLVYYWVEGDKVHQFEKCKMVEKNKGICEIKKQVGKYGRYYFEVYKEGELTNVLSQTCEAEFRPVSEVDSYSIKLKKMKKNSTWKLMEKI